MLHWGWYLLGLIVIPKITFMIFLSYHCPQLPIWFKIVGWIVAILGDIKSETKKD
jgi:hypothetical protein